MFSLLLIIHVTACVLIIFFVLLQAGRGAELGAAFGSVGQANTVRGKMTGLGKITTVVAVIFMITSLSLAYLSSEAARDSVVREIKPLPALPSVPEQTETLAPKVEEESSEELEQKEAPPLNSVKTDSQ